MLELKHRTHITNFIILIMSFFRMILAV